MRVVIAGSSGLIGTALVAALRSGDDEVLRLVRRPAKGRDEVSWDPSENLDPAVLEGAAAVVNLCGVSVGEKRWTGAHKQAIRDSRIGPTEVLARAVAAAKTPTLINASAVGYYGDTGSRIVDEAAPPGDGFMAAVCVDWEAATATAEEAGTRVVRVRTGVVLSEAGGILSRLRPLYKLGLGGRLGSGRQYFSWISLEDEVRAIIFAIRTAELVGPVNLTGPAPVTNAQFNSALGRVLSRPTPWIVPSFALTALLGEFAEEGVLSGQRAIPTKLEEAGFAFTHNTVGEALAAALTRRHE
jgi:uncharacterized protein (TIGR01777 family)